MEEGVTVPASRARHLVGEQIGVLNLSPTCLEAMKERDGLQETAIGKRPDTFGCCPAIDH